MSCGAWTPVSSRSAAAASASGTTIGRCRGDSSRAAARAAAVAWLLGNDQRPADGQATAATARHGRSAAGRYWHRAERPLRVRQEPRLQ